MQYLPKRYGQDDDDAIEVEVTVIHPEPQLPATTNTAVNAKMHEFLDYIKDSIGYEHYDKRLTVEDFMRISMAWQSWNAAEAPAPKTRPVPQIFSDTDKHKFSDKLMHIYKLVHIAEKKLNPRGERHQHSYKCSDQKLGCTDISSTLDILADMIEDFGYTVTNRPKKIEGKHDYKPGWRHYSSDKGRVFITNCIKCHQGCPISQCHEMQIYGARALNKCRRCGEPVWGPA